VTKQILCVDDEPRILESFERQLRKHFDVRSAAGPEAGLDIIAKEGPFAVVVSDLRMPVMDGIEFLSRVRQSTPDTVRIILTGNADLSAAIAAVNEGKIFQFLTKPCPADMLVRTLQAALEQHRLITAERELLEQTLQGSIGVLIEVLSLVNPTAFSRTHRIRRYVKHMAEQLKLPDLWQYELAATLSQIGCVVVPPDIMEKAYLHQALNSNEQQVISSHGHIGRRLLAKIPRLETVAQMVAHQTVIWTADESPADPVLIGGHLLHIASAFDNAVLQSKSLGEALAHMRKDKRYNPKFLDALRRLQLESAATRNRLLNLDQLKPGMVITADLFSKTGVLLLAKGHEITESAIARLESFASLFGVAEPISVTISDASQDVIEVEDLDVSDALAGISWQSGLAIRPN